MTAQRSVRASDRDRERAVQTLRDAYTAGCLDDDELDQRSGGAYSAKTLGELDDLTSDLPAWLTRSVPLPGYGSFAAGFPFLPYATAPPPALPLGLIAAAWGSWLIAEVTARARLAAIPLIVGWLIALRVAGWLVRPGGRRRARHAKRAPAVSPTAPAAPHPIPRTPMHRTTYLKLRSPKVGHNGHRCGRT